MNKNCVNMFVKNCVFTAEKKTFKNYIFDPALSLTLRSLTQGCQ